MKQNETQIIINDDGIASSKSSGVGHGLIGMAERANLLGGTFSAGPHRLSGYEVHVNLPQGQQTS